MRTKKRPHLPQSDRRVTSQQETRAHVDPERENLPRDRNLLTLEHVIPDLADDACRNRVYFAAKSVFRVHFRTPHNRPHIAHPPAHPHLTCDPFAATLLTHGATRRIRPAYCLLQGRWAPSGGSRIGPHPVESVGQTRGPGVPRAGAAMVVSWV